MKPGDNVGVHSWPWRHLEYGKQYKWGFRDYATYELVDLLLEEAGEPATSHPPAELLSAALLLVDNLPDWAVMNIIIEIEAGLSGRN